MHALEQARQAWERSQPQLFLELEDPALDVVSKPSMSLGDVTGPEHLAGVPMADDGTVAFPIVEAVRLRRGTTPASPVTQYNGRTGSPDRASACAATGGEV